MCLPVFTEIPEALTFTPLSVSLIGGEGVEGVKRTEHARFFCSVNGVGDCVSDIDRAGD